MSHIPLDIPCITCQVSLRDTLRPLPRKEGFYYCSRCQACYHHVTGQDMFGQPVDYLNPVKPGKESYLRAADDGVHYEMGIDPAAPNSDHTMPPEFQTEYLAECIEHDHVMSVPPPQSEHTELPNFDEEREIIKKSKTVKEFLKNSLYLEKPYDK